jgi:outer membrane protein
MKHKHWFVILFAAISMQSFSQAKWTLEDCINYAHANNLQVKRQQLQAETAKNNEIQSYFNIAPSLNSNIHRNYSKGHYLDPATTRYITSENINDGYSLTSSLNLFNGLQTYNNINRSKYAVLASLQNVDKEKIELTLNIATAYLNILFKQELLDVNNSQKAIIELQVDRTHKLVDAGSLARGDLLTIQSQLASEKLNVTNAQNDLNLAYLNLAQLLDLDSVGGFQIYIPDTIKPDLLTPIPTADQVYQDAVVSLPHVKAGEYFLKSSEKYLAIQKGKRSPQLYFGLDWQTYYSDAKDLLGNDPAAYGSQFKDNRAITLYAGVSIPIFNNWQVNNSISNARVQVSDAEYQLDQTKQQLLKQIQQAYNDAVSAREKYNASIEAVTSYQESFKYTEQKFNVGIVNSVEYNIAKNDFIKAQSDLTQAKYEYIFQTKILDFYRNIPLHL